MEDGEGLGLDFRGGGFVGRDGDGAEVGQLVRVGEQVAMGLVALGGDVAGEVLDEV